MLTADVVLSMCGSNLVPLKELARRPQTQHVLRKIKMGIHYKSSWVPKNAIWRLKGTYSLYSLYQLCMSLQRRYKDAYTALAGSAVLELVSIADLSSFFQKIRYCQQWIDIFLLSFFLCLPWGVMRGAPTALYHAVCRSGCLLATANVWSTETLHHEGAVLFFEP